MDERRGAGFPGYDALFGTALVYRLPGMVAHRCIVFRPSTNIISTRTLNYKNTKTKVSLHGHPHRPELNFEVDHPISVLFLFLVSIPSQIPVTVQHYSKRVELRRFLLLHAHRCQRYKRDTQMPTSFSGGNEMDPGHVTGRAQRPHTGRGCPPELPLFRRSAFGTGANEDAGFVLETSYKTSVTSCTGSACVHRRPGARRAPLGL